MTTEANHSLTRTPTWGEVVWRGILYGAWAAVAFAIFLAGTTFVDGMLRWPAGYTRHAESAAGIAALFGLLGSLPGAAGGLLLAFLARLLARRPGLALGVTVSLGLLLGALAGGAFVILLLMFNPEGEFSRWDVILMVGPAALAGAVAGWLIARHCAPRAPH